MELVSELRHRNVIRLAIAYAIEAGRNIDTKDRG